MRVILFYLLFGIALVSAKEYCQPSNTDCWPNAGQIEAFKATLSSPNAECLESFPTFTSKDEEGATIMNNWYSFTEGSVKLIKSFLTFKGTQTCLYS